MTNLAYGTPASSLKNKECADIQRPVVSAILPKMGIVRNAERAVVSGPSQYCGLGLDYLTVVHGAQKDSIPNWSSVQQGSDLETTN
jgi:hypothetical protein